MQKKVLFIAAFLAVSSLLNAQSFNEIIALVLKNNVSLKAAVSEAQALKEQGQVGLTLANPQVETAYLIGSPGREVNNRVDLSIKQEFDFATLSGSKRKLADAEALLIDCSIDEVSLQLKKTAAVLLTEVTYYNKQLAELQRRKLLDENIVKTYQLALDKGNCTIIDFNKAKLSLAQTNGEISKVQAAKESKLAQLQGLAHDNSIHYNDTVYAMASIILPEDFSQWAYGKLQDAPSLRTQDHKIAVSKAQMELAKKETLPSFSVGYTSELVKGSNYRGLSVGVELPLWANRNKLKAAQKAQQAAEEGRAFAETQLKSQYQQLFSEAKTYKKVAEELKATLKNIDTLPIMNKALSVGQITLTEYLLEKKYYYETYDQWLEAEKDAMVAIAELSALSQTLP